MRRVVAIVMAAGLFLLALPATAQSQPAIDVNRTQYESAGLDGHSVLRNGGVLDLTFGRQLGALEIHRVNGAAPNTDYLLEADIFVATACADDDPFGAFPVVEGTLSTNARGNGQFKIRFPGEAFDIAPDTFWVRWHLTADGAAAYQTSCVQVNLGS